MAGPGVLGNDEDPDEDSLTAVLVSAPAHGSLTLNVGGSFQYTADAAYVGPDSFTYRANDGLVNSNLATVSIDVTNQPPVVTDPGAQSDVVGYPVGLAISASDPDGDDLTYSAAGLPPGLSIDPASGYISGTIPSEAIDGSPYTVTVTASDGMASASATFEWAVTFVGLANPGAQSNLDGDVVSLALQGRSAAGPLTYRATGLPGGLDINPNTGLISGTLTTAAVSDKPYLVTVTASDGTHNSSQSFWWRVTAGTQMDVPGETLATAEPVAFGLSATAGVADEIGNNSYGSRDVDLYRVQLAGGDVLTVTVQVPAGVPPNDPNFGIALRIFDSSGNELGVAGDGVGLYPGDEIDFTAPADGTYYVGVSYRGNTSYTQYDVFTTLANGNKEIFLDMAWVALAYQGGGMNELRAHKASIDPVAYAGWVELDQALRENDPGKQLELATCATKKFIMRKQKVLQGVLDNAGRRVVTQLNPLLQTAKPLFPRGSWGIGDFGSLEYRLDRIYTVIFPSWVIYVHENPNKVKQFMADRIAGKL